MYALFKKILNINLGHIPHFHSSKFREASFKINLISGICRFFNLHIVDFPLQPFVEYFLDSRIFLLLFVKCNYQIFDFLLAISLPLYSSFLFVRQICVPFAVCSLPDIESVLFQKSFIFFQFDFLFYLYQIDFIILN